MHELIDELGRICRFGLECVHVVSSNASDHTDFEPRVPDIEMGLNPGYDGRSFSELIVDIAPEERRFCPLFHELDMGPKITKGLVCLRSNDDLLRSKLRAEFSGWAGRHVDIYNSPRGLHLTCENKHNGE
jgi:hypothetical protein